MDCGDLGADNRLSKSIWCLTEALTNGPSTFEVMAQLVIPTVVAIASLFVAFVSWRTAKRATQIAKDAADSERLRADAEIAREQHRQSSAYSDRLDDRLSALILEIGYYSAAADEWISAASDVELNWGGHPDDIPYPNRPSTSSLFAQLQSTMLAARDDDRIYLAQIDGYINDVITSTSLWKTSRRLKILMRYIRTWRDGSVSAKTFTKRIRTKRNTIAKNVDHEVAIKKARPKPKAPRQRKRTHLKVPTMTPPTEPPIDPEQS